MKVILLLTIVGLAQADLMQNLAQLKTLKEFENADLQKLYDEATATVPELIQSYGYPCETHQVETPDNYVLTLHRIPHGVSGKSNGKVAFLQHGLLSSSADWVLTSPTHGLGFILADQGYDVWMGNVRGNKYSRNNTVFDPDHDAEFWQYSWHQIGKIDLPTMIDYTLAQTGVDGVYYVGHSQGTTSFYVMLSSLPAYNAKIKVHISLAPIGFMNHMTSPLMQIIALWNKSLGALLQLIGINEFLPNNDFMSLIGNTFCHDDAITQFLCTNAIFAICGFSRKEMNATLLPVLMGHTPAGSSTKQFLHYAQEIVSGHFRQYDYGMISNLNVYGSIFPPEYSLEKITAPVYQIYSSNDWLSAKVDVEKLYNKLVNVETKAKFLLSDESFNHLDYMYGISAPQLVYTKVMSLMSRH